MALVQGFGSSSSSRTYVMFLVNVMLVVSIQTFIGNSGIVSFGHVAFMGIGAYTTALVTIPTGDQGRAAPRAAGDARRPPTSGCCPRSRCRRWPRSIVAAIFGGAIIRMTESTMAMATLALLVMVHTFFQNATTFTRGALGLAGIPVRTTLGVATVGAVVFLLVGRLYKESGPGLRLRATREDPLSAASVGTSVVRTRYGGWLLSAAMMGAAGSLWAQSVIAFNANQFYFAITFALLAMLVIGGRTSLTGAVAGAAIITFLTDTLARVEQGVAIGPWELPRDHGHRAVRDRAPDHHHADPAARGHLRPLGDRRPRAATQGRSRVVPGGPTPTSTSAVAAAGGCGRRPSCRPSSRPRRRCCEATQRREALRRASRALAGVDIDVRPGEILGLIGPNGSGKTTLLNVISGVYVPSEGQIAFDGQEIGGKKPHQVADLGLRARSRTSACSRNSPCGRTSRLRPARGTEAARVDERPLWFGLDAGRTREGREPAVRDAATARDRDARWCDGRR